MSKKLARSIADAARQMRKKFPDLEGYESVGTEGGLIQCRKPHWPDGVTISVPPTQGSNLAAVGANVVLGFYKAARQMPFIKSIRGMARGGTIEVPAYAGLMFWLLPEAAPNISCRSAIAQPQLKLSTASTVAELDTLDRTADESDWAYDQAKTDILGLLQFETGAHSILAVLHAIWADAGSLTGDGLQVREYALAGTANTPESVEIAIQRWQATNEILPTRNHGYFFADVLPNDVVYTLAVEAGIVAYARSITSVKMESPWVEDSRRFAGRAGSIACVGRYLLECGYSGLKVEGGSVVSGGARLQLYTRDNTTLEYTPAAAIELANLISGITTGFVEHRAIFPVGLLQPLAEYPSAEDNQDGGWSHNLLSNRWPMLINGSAREWWIYLNAITSETDLSPRWLTVAVDANAITAEIRNNYAPDLSWQFLFDNLVSSRSSALTAAADATRVGDGTAIGLAETEYWPVAYTGWPDADPPIPGGTINVANDIQGYLRGWHFTGVSAQSPGIDPATSPDAAGERFWAAPLPGKSLPVGHDYTSNQAPAGVFDESGRHYSVFFEPRHYVSDVIAVETGEFSDGGYANGSNYLKETRTQLWDDPLSQFYLWFAYRIRTAFPPPEWYQYPDAPHTVLTRNGTDDPNGIGAGSENAGVWNKDATRYYARRYHGEYQYEIRYRTQLQICNSSGLVYRQDISKYYVDGGSYEGLTRLKSSQLLNVWQWLPVHAGSVDYLWVLRQDYLSLGALLDDGDNCVDCEQEPVIEVWEIGESEATLLHRMALHPTSDTGAEWTDGTLLHPPYMLHGVQSDGKPYATVWTEWVGPSGEHGHLITEVLFTPGDPSTLTRSEKWGTGAKPANQPISVEARNAVHHGGKLYWIEGGESLVYKDSA